MPLPLGELLRVWVQAVTRLTFSSSGRQLAAATADHHVLLLLLVPWRGTQTRWEYIGRHAAHHGDITGLVFGEAPSGQTKLFSVGEGLGTPCCASLLEVLRGGSRVRPSQLSPSCSAQVWGLAVMSCVPTHGHYEAGNPLRAD